MPIPEHSLHRISLLQYYLEPQSGHFINRSSSGYYLIPFESQFLQILKFMGK
jgi:hypothetical protein